MDIYWGTKHLLGCHMSRVHLASLQSHLGLSPRTAVGPQGRCITNQRFLFPTRNSKGGEAARDRKHKGRARTKVGNWAEHTSTQRCGKIHNCVKGQTGASEDCHQTRFIVRDPKESSSKPKRLQQWEMKGCVEGWGLRVLWRTPSLTCPGKEIEGGCL